MTAHVCVKTSLSIPVWKPRIDIKYFPLSLFILFFEPECVNGHSLAKEPPTSTSPVLALSHTLSCLAFHLGSGIQTQALT